MFGRVGFSESELKFCLKKAFFIWNRIALQLSDETGEGQRPGEDEAQNDPAISQLRRGERLQTRGPSPAFQPAVEA